MKTFLFAKRNAKEILRDPLSLIFGLGFPLILLFLMTVINKNIPEEAGNPSFVITSLAPGMVIFGSAFLSLFSGVLIANDRSSSFLMLLFTSPMTSLDFILGYTVPMVVISPIQAAITLAAATFLGLPISFNLLPAIFVADFISLFFIGLGLLFGTILNAKAVSGVCGALLTNLTGWLSGIFIPISLLGKEFEFFVNILPFYHGVEAVKKALEGDFVNILTHIGVVSAYILVVFFLAVLFFNKKMSGDKN